MKVSKAIEILSFRSKELQGYYTIDFIDALKLGIEALKRQKEGRKSFIPHIVAPLLGETPEDDAT